MPQLQDQLRQNRPNPFNPHTSIPFDLSRRASVEVRICTPGGRVVRVLISGELAAGMHEVEWDGHGNDGESLPSGIYLTELRLDGKLVGARKLILLR